MTVSLEAGQLFRLDPERYDLNQIRVGVGWDARRRAPSSRWLRKLTGKFLPAPIDIDLAAVLLDANGMIARLGITGEDKNGKPIPLSGSDVIYFKNPKLLGGFVVHSGDNPTGRGPGDDEYITVQLQELPRRYDRIVFMAYLFRGVARGQHFGQVENAFIRFTDARGEEILRYNLSTIPECHGMCSVRFGEVLRRAGKWHFRALGDLAPNDTLAELIRDHVTFE